MIRENFKNLSGNHARGLQGTLGETEMEQTFTTPRASCCHSWKDSATVQRHEPHEIQKHQNLSPPGPQSSIILCLTKLPFRAKTAAHPQHYAERTRRRHTHELWYCRLARCQTVAPRKTPRRIRGSASAQKCECRHIGEALARGSRITSHTTIQC